MSIRKFVDRGQCHGRVALQAPSCMPRSRGGRRTTPAVPERPRSTRRTCQHFPAGGARSGSGAISQPQLGQREVYHEQPVVTPWVRTSGAPAPSGPEHGAPVHSAGILEAKYRVLAPQPARGRGVAPAALDVRTPNAYVRVELGPQERLRVQKGFGSRACIASVDQAGELPERTPGGPGEIAAASSGSWSPK